MKNENVSNCMVSYNTSKNEVGFYVDNCWNRWNDWYPPYYQQYYPTYIERQDKVSTSFKIITKLMEMGIIKDITAKQLIELTNTISEVI